MTRKRTRAAVAGGALTAIACLALVSCSSPTTPATVTVDVTAPVQSPTTSGTPASSVVPAAVPGETVQLAHVSFTLSERKIIPAKSSRGRLQLFMVKGCLNPGEEAAPFSYLRWTAYGVDSERFPPVSWSDIQPAYPSGDENVQPGQCVKGWIQFETDAQLVELRYANETGESITYKLS